MITVSAMIYFGFIWGPWYIVDWGTTANFLSGWITGANRQWQPFQTVRGPFVARYSRHWLVPIGPSDDLFHLFSIGGADENVSALNVGENLQECYSYHEHINILGPNIKERTNPRRHPSQSLWSHPRHFHRDILRWLKRRESSGKCRWNDPIVAVSYGRQTILSIVSWLVFLLSSFKKRWHENQHRAGVYSWNDTRYKYCVRRK